MDWWAVRGSPQELLGAESPSGLTLWLCGTRVARHLDAGPLAALMRGRRGRESDNEGLAVPSWIRGRLIPPSF